MSTQKVYVIDPSKQSATTPKNRAIPDHIRQKGFDDTPDRDVPEWLLAVRTYALGPINLILWPKGSAKFMWAACGALAVAVMVMFAFVGKQFFANMATDREAVFWLLMVLVPATLVSTTWARAISLCPTAITWPSLLRKPITVFAMGLMLPGLGLLVAGQRFRAAFAVWSLGMLAGVVLISKQWFGINITDPSTRLSLMTYEGVLVAAIALVAVGVGAWIVQALDGMRLTTTSVASGTLANGLAVALLAVLIVFGLVNRPTAVATNLFALADALEERGLLLIPAGLAESASRVDPATPEYLARAATLYGALGYDQRAQRAENLLQTRAVRFASAVAVAAEPEVSTALQATLDWHWQSSGWYRPLSMWPVAVPQEPPAP